jgi:hypothetical protein
MSDLAPITDGFLAEEVEQTAPVRQASGRFSFEDSMFNVPSLPAEPKTLRRFSSSIFGKLKMQQRLPEKRPASVLGGIFGGCSALKAHSPTIKRNRFGSLSRQSFIADSHRDSSETIGAGILSGPKVRPISHFFSSITIPRSPTSLEANAKQTVTAVEPPTGIFGVPLRQSITYANVAISLVDAEGKSYIYGYVPIVVAKCGVYLKEKGT